MPELGSVAQAGGGDDGDLDRLRWLACFAVLLEMMDRAPEIPET